MGPSTPTAVRVRLRLACSDGDQYRREYEPRFVAEGAFIASERSRPVGAHVHLKIELLDGTLAYSGDAVVVGPNPAGKRPGYVLRLTAAGGDASGAAAPAPARDREAAPAARPERVEPADALAELLFADAARSASPSAPGPLEVKTRPVALQLQELPPPLRPPQGKDPERAGSAGLPPENEIDWSDLTSEEMPARAPPGGDADAGLEQALPLPPAIDPTPPPIPLAARSAGGDPGSSGAEDARPRSHRRLGLLLLAAGALVVAAALAVFSQFERRSAALETAFAAEIRSADDRLAVGDLAGKGAGSALDHLLAARELKPHDARVTRRLELLADKFEDLGVRALQRGDGGEARVHFEAAIRANPGRALARKNLAELGAGAPPQQATEAAPDAPGGSRP